jgi:hypothetical protein
LGSESISFGARQGFSIISRNILGLSPLSPTFQSVRNGVAAATLFPISRPQVIAPSLFLMANQLSLPDDAPERAELAAHDSGARAVQLPPTKLAEIYSNPNS